MKPFDAIIVGGGIIGCGVARELARRGLRAAVLDRQPPGLEASWAAAGMLTPAAESEEALALVPLAKASLALYDEFVAQIEQESGARMDYRRDGSLEVFFGEDAETRLGAWLALVRRAGFEAQPLAAEELRRAEPHLAPGAHAGAFLRGEGAIDNRLLSAAVAEAARRGGVELRARADVQRVLRDGPRVTGVEASGERFLAPVVVLAAGCFSAQIEGMAPYAPTTPARGQMLALRASPEAGLPRHVLRGPAYLVPRRDGRVIVGSTVEHAGFEKAVTPAGIARLLSNAVGMIPALADVPIVETWSGLRPDTPDHLPILGPTDLDGLWIATGHFRNGILLTPATARAMGEWITEGKTTLPVASFSPMRFAPEAHRAQG